MPVSLLTTAQRSSTAVHRCKNQQKFISVIVYRAVEQISIVHVVQCTRAPGDQMYPRRSEGLLAIRGAPDRVFDLFLLQQKILNTIMKTNNKINTNVIFFCSDFVCDLSWGVHRSHHLSPAQGPPKTSLHHWVYVQITYNSRLHEFRQCESIVICLKIPSSRLSDHLCGF